MGAQQICIIFLQLCEQLASSTDGSSLYILQLTETGITHYIRTRDDTRTGLLINIIDSFSCTLKFYQRPKMLKISSRIPSNENTKWNLHLNHENESCYILASTFFSTYLNLSETAKAMKCAQVIFFCTFLQLQVTFLSVKVLSFNVKSMNSNSVISGFFQALQCRDNHDTRYTHALQANSPSLQLNLHQLL